MSKRITLTLTYKILKYKYLQTKKVLKIKIYMFVTPKTA